MGSEQVAHGGKQRGELPRGDVNSHKLAKLKRLNSQMLTPRIPGECYLNERILTPIKSFAHETDIADFRIVQNDSARNRKSET